MAVTKTKCLHPRRGDVVLDAEKLRDAMTRKGLPQARVAEATGVSQSTISRMVNDQPVQLRKAATVLRYIESQPDTDEYAAVIGMLKATAVDLVVDAA